MSYASSSYNNDRPIVTGEVEYAADPASGGFLQSDYKKHDDLKQMLDGSKDSLKLEAMKRIIGMVAKGRDASDLFPAVVKNVVSKNIEVKKLVYVYLERYAEEQQDLALLSISTFQRALKDPNQLIRASALRVLSSIRVEMIVPIVMLAIRDSASDMSPYVRKTAAHAIPKLYSLDPELKDELVLIIKKLLAERTTIVIGSAVMAFSEVCPERNDLLHQNFRKLCTLLVDVDEWGQLVILNVLTRYARENFSDPNTGDVNHTDDENSRPFYDTENSDKSDDNDDKKKDSKKGKKKSQSNSGSLDPDHRLLLRSANPLLQSRNAGVVMSVAQLYYHAGPASDLPQAAKALIRLLRGPIEVQSIVLHSIASLTIGKKSMFEPFLKTFFVRTSDPTHIKILKLEILSNLATEGTVPVILREFQTYITSSDKTFVAATIQAIDRCAANIKTVTDTCLQGLLDLLSNKDEAIVAESVVVIKKLLQSERSVDHKSIIAQMVRLLDHITVGAARAAILWLLGEYRSDRIAPDVLRKCAKSFVQEDDLVKLQILNLAVKLCLTNPAQTRLLAQYVFTLARYDPSYDIRDRARFLKRFVFPGDNDNDSILLKYAKKIFLVTKPAPLLESKFKERQQYTLGSLSHYVSGRASGYIPLPSFPAESTPSSLRDPDKQEPSESTHKNTYLERNVNKLFYSESDASSSAASSSEAESSGEENASESEQESVNSTKKKSKKTVKKTNDAGSNSSCYGSNSSNSSSSGSGSESDEASSDGSNNSQSESNESSSNESSSESDGDEDSGAANNNSNSNSNATVNDNKSDQKTTSDSKTKEKEKEKEKSNLDLLLELGEIGDALPIMTPTYGGFLSPVSQAPQNVVQDSVVTVSPYYVPLRSFELLSKITGRGLLILYRFTRAPHLYSSKMVSLELFFNNQGTEEITNITADKKGLSTDQSLHPFATLPILGVGCSQSGIMGIDFNDTTQSAQFMIKTSLGEATVNIKPPVGELMRCVTMSENHFMTEQKRLRGMTQAEGQSGFPGFHTTVCQRVVDIANMAPITTQGDILRFAGQTLSTQCLVLLTIQIVNNSQTAITVNCDKMVDLVVRYYLILSVQMVTIEKTWIKKTAEKAL